MSAKRGFDSYFTEVSVRKRLFYITLVIIVASVAFVSVFEPLLTPSACLQPDARSTKEFGNSLFQYNPCRYERKAYLLFLTPDECSFARRLIIAVILGGFIGWERRQADRPAGIRTMALVSLGSCLFTINSAFAFLDGPMEWDASRISAAIPSGVGFLGAGLIFKQAEKDEQSGDVTHVVHGLTTAASLWLSAAVGVACGGTLYFAAFFGTAVMLVLLRFGPRMDTSSTEKEDQGEDETEVDKSLDAPLGYGGVEDQAGIARNNESASLLSAERREMKAHSTSMRKRAHLASLV